jgi:hypothetical protein
VRGEKKVCVIRRRGIGAALAYDIDEPCEAEPPVDVSQACQLGFKRRVDFSIDRAHGSVVEKAEQERDRKAEQRRV